MTQNPDDIWFLQVDGSEFGPFRVQEFHKFSKLKGTIYAWHRGMENWQRVDDMAHLQKLIEKKEFSISDFNSAVDHGVNLQNGRGADRYQVVATIVVKEGLRSKVAGVCADVSMTGFQVLLSPGATFKAGQIIEFELIPVSISGLPNLQTSASVQWVKDAEERMGLKFQPKTPTEKNKIENFFDILIHL